MMRSWLWLCAAILNFYSEKSVLGDEWPGEVPRIARLSSEPGVLFQWKNLPPQVQLPDPGAREGLPYVDLYASTKLEDWSFLYQQQQLAPKPMPDGTQDYTFRVYLRGLITEFTISGVGPYGEVKEEKGVIAFAGWDRWKGWSVAKNRKSTDEKRLSFAASLGASYISYSDVAITNFNEIALTPKIFARYWLKPKVWDIDANLYFNALVLASNLPSVSARFLGINLRVGYLLPFVREPWSLDVMGGVFFSDAFVTGSAFGYSNLLYPEFYPVLRRVLNPRDTLGLYLKVVPMERSLSLSLTHRELATGLQWVKLLRTGHPLLINFDYSNLIFLPTNTNVSTSVVSMTLSVGYGF